MAKGYWGSRFSIVNLLCTKFVFVAVWWRVTCRRFKNSLSQVLRPKAVRLVNDTATAVALRRWLDQGYNKLNIGGGSKNLYGFLNIDFVASPTVKRLVVANILDLSFVPNACISHIHTNHAIEHLTQDQLQQQLKEYHRILKEDGLLTIRCPNALGAAYGFWFEPVIEREKEQFIALGFPADEKLADPADRWMHRDLFGLLHWFYGDMGNIANQHLDIITPSRVKASVEQAGFTILKMAAPEAVNIVLVARKLASIGQHLIIE